jgi:hypothetical protein
MAKTKISEFSATAADNTDITNINIAEGCSPANVNNAIRSLMSVLKNQQDGSSGDPFTVAGTLVSSGTVDITGAFRLDGTAGASGQALVSAGGANTPTWSTLGTMAAQNSTTVAITGGTITGITDLAVADGGTGASTLSANAVLLGNGTSALQTVDPSTSGNVLTSNGTTWTSAALNKLTLDTAKASTSGTSIDFTGIPSWVKRITVMFDDVSTNGSSIPAIQIGDSGGVETTGYSGQGNSFTKSSGAINIVTTTANTIGFNLSSTITTSASATLSGTATITNFSGNVWVFNSFNSQGDGSSGAGTGVKTLSATLNQVRITTVNGTDTFDAGSINILYE